MIGRSSVVDEEEEADASNAISPDLDNLRGGGGRICEA